MQMLYIVILWMGLVGPLSYFAVAVSAFCKRSASLICSMDVWSFWQC